MKLLLILEDNAERSAAFREAVASLGDRYDFVRWTDAPRFMAEAGERFTDAALISLDHDLNPLPGSNCDPGTGLDVARFLADHLPVCPVIIHSSNADRAWSMHNELRFAGWPVERVGPFDDTRWIGTRWLAQVRTMLAAHPNTHVARRPDDHRVRLDRARLSLDGLGLGDCTPAGQVRRTIELARTIPRESPPETAAAALGNGSGVIAPDTVPFALWCAARHADDFAAALAAAIQTGGDCDTNAAIVGGIVALAVGYEGIRPDWLAAREGVDVG